jgi:hypothetical protein
MRAFASAELLDLWDAGQAGTPIERTLLLLRSACVDAEAIDQWTLGLLNARLLELRTLLFGRQLECLANCPRCDAIAETELDCDAMRSLAVQSATPSSAMHVFDVGGHRIRFRLPNAADLIELGRAPRADGIQLMKRIVDSRDDPSDADRAGIAESLARQLGELDPLAHIELVMRCPECAHDWSEPLYFIDVLWTEIGALASRLIQEVAHLAHAFGWREADILAMSPRRRQRYLEQLAA